MASILIVDDELDMCDMLQTILEAAGYQVVSTTDARDVPRFMKQRTFDVVIADIVMPRRDGVDVVHEIRKTYPTVGVVAMSGATPLRRELYLEAVKLAGADATFSKPFSKAQVLACIAEAREKAATRISQN